MLKIIRLDSFSIEKNCSFVVAYILSTMKKLVESLFQLFFPEYEELSQNEKIQFWGKVFWINLGVLVFVLYALSQL
jgi:hypothetical protein